MPVFVTAGEEEHVARLDEGAVTVGNGVGDEALIDAVGEPPGVKPILEQTVAIVEHVIGHDTEVTVTRWRT